MKKLQRYWMVGVFILVLAATTLAGDIHTGSPQPPPPPPPVTGDIHIPGTPSEPIETFADIAVGLFQTMLTVF